MSTRVGGIKVEGFAAQVELVGEQNPSRCWTSANRADRSKGSLVDWQDRDWRDRAACRDEDTELFFPTGTTGPALQQIDEAKAICARCPVISNCLNFALQTGQDYGIWGGLTAEERRAQIRRHPRPHRAS